MNNPIVVASNGQLIYLMFTGYYMYIETSSPRVAGDNAKLEISVSGKGELSCLEFYYHMYGDTMGTLNVFSGNTVVFNLSGNQGDYWIKWKKPFTWITL